MPRSPLPPVLDHAPLSNATARHAWKIWIVPVTAVAVTALLSVAVIATLLTLGKSSMRPTNGDRTAEQRFLEHESAGRQALRNGEYQRATEELRRALALADQAPHFSPNSAVRRRLEHDHRQADLLASLLSESLSEIARHSSGLPDDEWQATFRARYSGKSIILDDTIRRDTTGRHYHTMRIDVVGAPGQIDLDRLAAIHQISDLVSPQRMFFGFRLAAIERDTNGVWRFAPERNSMVLLTDPEVLSRLSIAVDPELHAVLQRQEKWRLGMLP